MKEEEIFESIAARLKALVRKWKVLHAEAHSGRQFTQRQLRVRLQKARQLSVEMGQIQFDMRNDPIWPFLEEEDHAELDKFVNDTIRGLETIDEALKGERQ